MFQDDTEEALRSIFNHILSLCDDEGHFDSKEVTSLLKEAKKVAGEKEDKERKHKESQSAIPILRDLLARQISRGEQAYIQPIPAAGAEAIEELFKNLPDYHPFKRP